LPVIQNEFNCNPFLLKRNVSTGIVPTKFPAPYKCHFLMIPFPGNYKLGLNPNSNPFSFMNVSIEPIVTAP